MRALLIIALILIYILPAIAAAPLQISGSYGSSWLSNNGNKNVVKVPQAGSLWNWGTIPKGQYLSNGTLQPIRSTTIYYPSFLESNSIMIGREQAGAWRGTCDVKSDICQHLDLLIQESG